jgi:hypothetical protein
MDHTQLRGEKGNAGLNVPGWSDESHRPVETTTIDTLLLQGVLAFCHQSGFGFFPWCSPADYESIERRLALISDMELASIAETRCMRDGLVWTYVCVAGALYSRAQDTREPKRQGGGQSYELLLIRIFRLFNNPRHLWWSNISRTLTRFWMPDRFLESWEQCWNSSLRHWRMSTTVSRRESS